MTSALQDGVIFAGRYQILRCIAAGGMGAVYEVVHMETERRRALKVMLPHVLQSDELRERFKREAKVAAHIDSEFIVEVFDAGVDDATAMPFLVMELLRGEELGKRLKRIGRLPPSDVAAHVHQTALALDKTHRAAIVHRDLKPENLFLTEREEGPPRIKVLDFGVAKVIAESATTGATQSIGTPLYMAPEQFNPAAHLTGAADIYALGMVTYTLLVGKAYWGEEARGGNIFALANVTMRGPTETASVRAARRGVALPPAFDAWFARITAHDPGQRFPTATEASRALADVLGVARAPALSLVEVAQFPPQPPSMPLPAFPPSQPYSTPAPFSGPAHFTPAPFSAPALASGAVTLPPSVLSTASVTLPPNVLSTAPVTAIFTAPATASPAQPSRAGLVAAVAITGIALLGGGIYLIAGGSSAPAPAAAASAAPPAPPPAARSSAPLPVAHSSAPPASAAPATPPTASEAPAAASSQPAPTTTPAPAETPAAERASAPPPASTAKAAASKPHTPAPSRYSRD